MQYLIGFETRHIWSWDLGLPPICLRNGQQTLGYPLPLRRYLTAWIFCESIRSYFTHTVCYSIFLHSLRLTILLGGSYLFGRSPSFMKVFRYLQLKLEELNIHIRMEIIAYSMFFLVLFSQVSNHNAISWLVPDALYPYQLIDASQALEYPRSTGIPFRTSSSQATPQAGTYSPILMSSSAYKPIAGEIKLSCVMQTCNSSMLWDLARPRRPRIQVWRLRVSSIRVQDYLDGEAVRMLFSFLEGAVLSLYLNTHSLTIRFNTGTLCSGNFQDPVRTSNGYV